MSRTATSEDDRSTRLGTDRAKAIEYLITSNWLIAEAARRRLIVTRKAIRRRVEERFGSISAAVPRKLTASGRTVADAEFEARAALSASKLREAALARGGAVTENEVEDYYNEHAARFRTESRVVDLIEDLGTRSAATALGRRLGAGSRFSRRALHETVKPMTRGEEETYFDGSLVHAIFAARPHIVSGPVRYVGKWVIFVVRRVLEEPVPLAGVSGAIERRLRSGGPQQALRTFATAFQREWRARTHCRAGFVAPGCSESPARPRPELRLMHS